MNERDSELDTLWRRHSRETPPAALDDAIRAAAHRAVHAKPSATLSRARAPWPAWATFAAAAGIGAIAIGIWQLLPHDVDERQMVASDVPTHAAAPARPVGDLGSATTTEAPATSKSPNQPADAADAKAIEGLPAARKPMAASRSTEMQPMAHGPVAGKTRDRLESPPPPAAKTSPRPDANEDKPQRMEAVVPPAAPIARESNAGAAQLAAAAPSMQRQAIRSSADYVVAIRRALAAHRDADAAATLGAMRQQYADADARMPADLRQWAASIPPTTR